MLVTITRKILSHISLIVEPSSLEEKWPFPKQMNDRYSHVYEMEQLRWKRKVTVSISDGIIGFFSLT